MSKYIPVSEDGRKKGAYKYNKKKLNRGLKSLNKYIKTEQNQMDEDFVRRMRTYIETAPDKHKTILDIKKILDTIEI